MSMIQRTDLSGLIPEPVTREIFQGVVEQSAALKHGRKLPNMTSKTQSINVLDMLPMAYWVDGDTIIYPGPYARYLYYGKVMVDSITGRGPFYIPEVGYRFRRGTVLKPTSRDLVFDKTAHPNATAFWFEVSKARNLKKWKNILRRAITDGK